MVPGSPASPAAGMTSEREAQPWFPPPRSHRASEARPGAHWLPERLRGAQSSRASFRTVRERRAGIGEPRALADALPKDTTTTVARRFQSAASLARNDEGRGRGEGAGRQRRQAARYLPNSRSKKMPALDSPSAPTSPRSFSDRVTSMSTVTRLEPASVPCLTPR